MVCEPFLWLAETLQLHQAAAGIGISFRIRTRLYAAAAKVKIHTTLNSPRCFSFRNSAMSFNQPKHFSMRLRFFWLTA